jgi:hypothetical protein
MTDVYRPVVIRPGDGVIIEVAQATLAQAEAMAAALHKRFPGCRFAVLVGGRVAAVGRGRRKVPLR